MDSRRRSRRRRGFLLLLVLVLLVVGSYVGLISCALDDGDQQQQQQHIVGDSIWSIPPTDGFYSDWSNNRTFSVGDSLVFRFETGFYDVIQVSRREFQSCGAENPFKTFLIGPAVVRLDQAGVHYFICSFANYCLLGQKLSAAVTTDRPRR